MTHEEIATLRTKAPHLFLCPNCGGNIEPEALEETLETEGFEPEDYEHLVFFCPGYTFEKGRCGGDGTETAAYWQM